MRENDVLYLMVVNMPTEEEEEELVKAKTREIARSKGEKSGEQEAASLVLHDSHLLAPKSGDGLEARADGRTANLESGMLRPYQTTG